MDPRDRNIYLYWVGKEYKLISILRNMIYLHTTNGVGYKVNLITDKNIREYIKDIPDYFSSLCPAHQADFVRVHVICDYGGIWLDSDTLVLDSLDSLFELIEKKTGFFIKQNNTILWNGIFGSKKRTPLMIEWKKNLNNILNKKKEKITWTEVGCQMLQSMYNINPSLYNDYKIFEGLNNLYPVNWKNCITEFIEKPYDNYKNIVREYQPLVVLVNSVYKKLENKTINEILNGNMPINYFINKSFENNRKIIYLKIAKNMGTSMVKYLSNHPNYSESYFIEDWNEIKFYKSKIITLAHQSNISQFKKIYNKLFDYAHKIIIFRKPLDRIVSSYNYLKLKKGYSFYLNKIDRNIVKDTKSNYNSHYVHFETLQCDSIDYEKERYHDNLYNWVDMSNLLQLKELFIKLNINLSIIEKLNESKYYNIIQGDSLILFNEYFKKDIELYEKINYKMNDNKKIFTGIYKNGIWNNNNSNIPLSGPGSSLENTREITALLEDFIYKYNCNSILDLGCGDLSWMRKTKFFLDDNINYTGVDVVDSLIDIHNTNYPNRTFLCEDITEFSEFNKVSIILMRDVIFHLKNNEILKIFNNIKNRFDFICITSCKNSENNDIFNKWRFSEKNLHLEPFNITDKYKYKIFEKKFNRNLYIYEHSEFY